MFKTKVKGIIAILLIFSLVLGFAGCSKESKTSQESKLSQIKSNGKIVLGTAADYPPYEFHKEIDGKDTIVGFDIEIAKAIAEDLGVELEIKDMKFDGLLAALVADKIDFIVAGMVPTEEREQSVDFTKQYYQAEQSILIKAEDADKFKTKEDFKGAVVGAQKSTIQEEIAKGIEGAQVKSLSKITDLVLELSNDKIDAIVLVKPVATAYAKSNPDLFVPEISFGTEEGVAGAVNKGNKELLEAINQTLERLINEGKIDQFVSEATELADSE
ncbi:transporter substrate-binding domain-containing protein [Paramaledivibacter caminithermalis]|jgi:polar amino acid transport system substrate-binding protein|uniref:Amino acid ABC transporter substrate-binding protein, PAAT family n=1 Tax=Paramaledivibacter caminithermalis (strain DSM 15212 / CIP 107654 / DViRD3) TaxID=1121301 RepID=A0A1M6MNC5_PARC5|nr:transporter substrate-binding domain-containing protein [Paramaledivibacter caminithermalis]SHJ84939.1 amino acid ABC transporter substrate-binding protein, PAAT family [Paramaledivibacter caminithermalis DSM 15212]